MLQKAGAGQYVWGEALFHGGGLLPGVLLVEEVRNVVYCALSLIPSVSGITRPIHPLELLEYLLLINKPLSNLL